MNEVVDKAKINTTNTTNLIHISKEEYEAVDPQDYEDSNDECGLELTDAEYDEPEYACDVSDDDFEPLPYEEEDEEFVVTAGSADSKVITFERKAVTSQKNKQDKKSKNKKNDDPNFSTDKATSTNSATASASATISATGSDTGTYTSTTTSTSTSTSTTTTTGTDNNAGKPVVSTDITYAPKVQPVEGVIELCVIGLKWKDKDGPKGSIHGVGNGVAKTYRDISGGKLQFKVTAKTVRLGLNFHKKNLNKAEKIAMAVVNKAKKTGKYDVYAIISGMGRPHAGNNIAHLHGTLIRDALHEIGHILPNKNNARRIPSKLGHSGVIERKDGKDNLDNTGDGGSFMSRFASNTIAGSQFYYMGWLDVNQVASHDPATTKVYQLQPVSSNTNLPGYLKGVLIPRKVGRDQFLSVANVQGKPVLNLYYTTGGGSQKMGSFSEQRILEDLIIKKVGQENSLFTVEISPNPEFDGKIDEVEMVINENDDFEGDDSVETLENTAVAPQPKPRPKNR